VSDWSDEQTDELLLADHRNYYKVEQWSRDGMRVERMLFAGNSLDRARAISRPRFAAGRAAATPSASAHVCSKKWPLQEPA
jgi:hypothetical protein